MSQTGHVLIAMDKFKGSLTSAEANRALADGIAQASTIEIRCVGVADGGDGLLEVLRGQGAPVQDFHFTAAGESKTFRVAGPVAQLDGAVAIESAHVVGLAQRQTLDPLGASSRPVGAAIRTLMESQPRPETILIGVGGTDCTDGGLGLVLELGARALDAAGDPLADGGGSLGDLAVLELADLPSVLGSTQLLFATDVDSPLTGPSGAAHLFAPQKGADPQQVATLETGLRTLADFLKTASPQWSPEMPGMGAGGGMPACSTALAGARIVAGAPLAMQAAGLDEALAGAGMVVTGEGSVDTQTFHGKGPAHVISLAAAAGVPVTIVAGVIEPTPELEQPVIQARYAVRDLALSDADSIAEAGKYLREIGREIGARLETSGP